MLLSLSDEPPPPPLATSLPAAPVTIAERSPLAAGEIPPPAERAGPRWDGASSPRDVSEALGVPHVRPSPRLPVWTGNIELRGSGVAPGLFAGTWQNGCAPLPARAAEPVCAWRRHLPLLLQAYRPRCDGEENASVDD